jgi:hypothetical protein
MFNDKYVGVLLIRLYYIYYIPRFTNLIRSSKTARRAKSRKTKISFPLLPEKRRQEQRSVCEKKELV